MIIYASMFAFFLYMFLDIKCKYIIKKNDDIERIIKK